MKHKFFLSLLAVVAVVVSCQQFDDSSLWEKLYELSEKVSRLEAQCNQMNSDLTTLKSVVSALQAGEYVTACSELADGSGYTIVFSSGKSIALRNGKDGKDGANASAPKISVRKDTDGVYYWTLDGDWLTDESGMKIRAEGRDGKDGQDGADAVAPQLKIEDGYWYISVDGGKTWTKSVKATGEDGKDGQDGKDGADAVAPQLKIEDGYWYISVDGGKTWTKSIEATGEDGKDGQDGKDGADAVAPQLKIEDGYWYISVDGGKTWTMSGKATGDDGQDGKNGEDGKDGDTLFRSVTVEDGLLVIILNDGEETRIELPMASSSDSAVVTGDVEDVACDSATAYGICRTADVPGAAVIYGIEYSDKDLNSAPMTVRAAERDSEGNYSCLLSCLEDETLYYYRAYCFNNGIKSYGEIRTFTTMAIPDPIAVDLGLSVEWASCNIGASVPERSGRYFAWGDVNGQIWNGSSWSGGEFEFSNNPSYELDSNGNLKPQYDAAFAYFGGNWRMPTKAEFEELIDNCTSTWTDDYQGTGVAGKIFTSEKPGYTDKSIFLPAAGWRNDCKQEYFGEKGTYWSSSYGTVGLTVEAEYFSFGPGNDGGCYMLWYYTGLPVRPVYREAVNVTGVSLNKTAMSLTVGSNETLVATITPSDASNKDVTWSSSNPSVATVDDSGKVTGVAKGEATITVTTVDGSKTATCSVTVNVEHVAVDLGLSVKWSSFNLGASAPEEYGDYYAWGATEPWYNGDPKSPSSWKKSGGYTWANCPFNGGGNNYDESFWYAHKSKCVDTSGVLLPANDAAHVSLGGNWRMPTKAECEEIKNTSNCSWTWTTLNGIAGYKVQSKISGYTDKWIFLPAAGLMSNTSLDLYSSYYWSSSVYSDGPADAWYIVLSSARCDISRDERADGQSIRPVSD